MPFFLYIPGVDKKLSQLYLIRRAGDAHVTVGIAFFQVGNFNIRSTDKSRKNIQVIVSISIVFNV